jgi:hypothetical protein
MMQKNLKKSCCFHPCPASTILVLTNVRACIRTTPIYPETPKHFYFESSHPRRRTLYDFCQSPYYNLERILVQHASLLTDVLPRHVPDGVKRIDTCAAAVLHIARRGTAIGNNQYSTSFGKEILLFDDCCTQSKTETCFHAAEMRGPVMTSVSSDFEDQMRSLSARVFLYNSSLSIDKHHSRQTP